MNTTKKTANAAKVARLMLAFMMRINLLVVVLNELWMNVQAGLDAISVAWTGFYSNM